MEKKNDNLNVEELLESYEDKPPKSQSIGLLEFFLICCYVVILSLISINEIKK